MRETDDGRYMLRGGDAGAARLRVLGRAAWPTTRGLLARVGVRPGMHVLDLGRGGGNVTVRIARLVSPGGAVVGVDGDATVLERARTLARERAVAPQFRVGDAATPLPERDLDLAYARFLLSHVQEPSAVLAQMVAAVRPGGTVAVEDVDFSGHLCHPPSPAFARYVDLYVKLARARGGDATIGPRLPSLLEAAGLRDVQLRVVQPTFRDGEGKRVAQLTLEGIREAAVSSGLATDDEIDALLAALDAHRRALGSLQSLARIVQAWGRRPAAP